MKPFIALPLLLLSLWPLTAAPAPVLYAYSGELNGVPCQVALAWAKSDDVAGFLERTGGKPLMLRLEGENYMQGKMRLKAARGYEDIAILSLSKSTEGGKTKWSGIITFKDGQALPISFRRL